MIIKKGCISFDIFINPHGKDFKNKNLDINNLSCCSYVRYLIIEHCNGEIENNCFVVEFDKEFLIDCYFGPYVIYAINYLDNIVCEVI